MIDARANSPQMKRTVLFRIASYLTVTSFFFMSISADVIIGQSYALSAPEAAHKTASANLLPDTSFHHANGLGFKIPKKLGHISESWAGDNANRTVFLIQDAHCNYDAQVSISKIIDYCRKTYGVKNIDLEGGAGKYDFSEYMRIANPDIRQKVSDYFLRSGLINGAEYYAINYPNAIYLNGIEESGLYIENLNIYRAYLTRKNTIDRALESIETGISQAKELAFSEELLALDSRYQEYTSGSMDLKSYVPYIINKASGHNVDTTPYRNLSLFMECLKYEGKVDFIKADAERFELIKSLKNTLSKAEFDKLALRTIQFKNRDISEQDFYDYLAKRSYAVQIQFTSYPELKKYMNYINIYGNIDRSAISGEINKLITQIKEHMFTQETQRELDRISNDYYLIRDLFAMKLTREDYGNFLKNYRSFTFREYLSFFKKFAGVYGKGIECDIEPAILDPYLRDMSDFYAYSFLRDKSFISNMLSEPTRRSELNTGTSILVSGGFHTENLKELFRKNNIAYVAIIPNFKNEPGYKCPYFNVLSGGMSPFESSIKAALSVLQIASLATELGIKVNPPERLELYRLGIQALSKVYEINRAVAIRLKNGKYLIFSPEDRGARADIKDEPGNAEVISTGLDLSLSGLIDVLRTAVDQNGLKTKNAEKPGSLIESVNDVSRPVARSFEGENPGNGSFSLSLDNPFKGKDADKKREMLLRSCDYLREESILFYGILDDSDPLTKYARKVFRKTLKENDKDFRLLILKEHNEANAFALPDGTIFITRELLASIEYEEELAAIFAHEVVHVIRKHAEQSNALLDGMKNDFSIQNALSYLGQQRMQEYEADLSFLLTSGRGAFNVNPKGLLIFQERQRSLEESADKPHGVTHGAWSDRAENTKSALYYIDIETLLDELTPIPAEIKQAATIDLKERDYRRVEFRNGVGTFMPEEEVPGLQKQRISTARDGTIVSSNAISIAISKIMDIIERDNEKIRNNEELADRGLKPGNKVLDKKRVKVNQRIMTILMERLDTEIFDNAGFKTNKEKVIAKALYLELVSGLNIFGDKHKTRVKEIDELMISAENIAKKDPGIIHKVMTDKRFSALKGIFIIHPPKNLLKAVSAALIDKHDLSSKPGKKGVTSYMREAVRLSKAIELIYDNHGFSERKAGMVLETLTSRLTESLLKRFPELAEQAEKEAQASGLFSPEESGNFEELRKNREQNGTPGEKIRTANSIAQALHKKAVLGKPYKISDYTKEYDLIVGYIRKNQLSYSEICDFIFYISIYMPGLDKLTKIEDTETIKLEKKDLIDDEIEKSEEKKYVRHVLYRLMLDIIKTRKEFQDLDKLEIEVIKEFSLQNIAYAANEMHFINPLKIIVDPVSGKLVIMETDEIAHGQSYFSTTESGVEDGKIFMHETPIIDRSDFEFIKEQRESIEERWLLPERSHDDIVKLYKLFTQQALSFSLLKLDRDDTTYQLYIRILASYLLKKKTWNSISKEVEKLEKDGVPVSEIITSNRIVFGPFLINLWRLLPENPRENQLKDIRKLVDYIENPFLKQQYINYYYRHLWPKLSFEGKLDALFGKKEGGFFDVNRFNDLIEFEAKTQEQINMARKALSDNFDAFMMRGSREMGIAAIFGNMTADPDFSKRFMLSLLSSWQSDNDLKDIVYGRIVESQHLFPFVLHPSIEKDDTYDKMGFISKLRAAEKVVRMLLSSNDMTKIAIMRKLMTGRNGLVSNSKLRVDFLKTLIHSVIEDSKDKDLIKFLDEVITAFDKIDNWSPIFFALQATMLDKMCNAPRESTPWLKVRSVNDDIFYGYMGLDKSTEVFIDEEQVYGKPEGEDFLKYPWRQEEKAFLYSERTISAKLQKMGIVNPVETTEKMTALGFIVEFAKKTGSMGVRFLQLLPQFAKDLPQSYINEFSQVYDSVSGQSKLTAIETLEREWPGIWDEIETVEERVGGGSLMTVYKVKTKEGKYQVVKVLNPNLKYHLENNSKLVRQIIDELSKKDAETFAIAGLAVDEVEEWIKRDVGFKGFISKDRVFKSQIAKQNKVLKDSGAAYSLYVPETYGEDNGYFIREEFIGPKANNLTEWDQLVKKGHNMKEIIAIIAKSFIDQLQTPGALIHSDVHIGNYRITDDKRIAILDRNFYLELTPEMREAVETLIDPMVLFSMNPEDIFHLISSMSDSALTGAQEERCISAVQTFISEIQAGDFSSVSHLVVKLRANGLKLPLELTLIFKNLNALQQMATKAGFENGLIEAYMYALDNFSGTANAEYMRVKQKGFYARHSLKDGKKLSIKSIKDTLGLAGTLLRNNRARSYTVNIGGRPINVVIENPISLTEQDIDSLLNQALARSKGSVENIPETILIATLDSSTHLFEDHIRNGFIGVNTSVLEMENIELRDILLKVGLVHELSHECTGQRGRRFENEQFKRDIQYTIHLLEGSNIPQKDVIVNFSAVIEGMVFIDQVIISIGYSTGTYETTVDDPITEYLPGATRTVPLSQLGKHISNKEPDEYILKVREQPIGAGGSIGFIKLKRKDDHPLLERFLLIDINSAIFLKGSYCLSPIALEAQYPGVLEQLSGLENVSASFRKSLGTMRDQFLDYRGAFIKKTSAISSNSGLYKRVMPLLGSDPYSEDWKAGVFFLLSSSNPVLAGKLRISDLTNIRVTLDNLDNGNPLAYLDFEDDFWNESLGPRLHGIKLLSPGTQKYTLAGMNIPIGIYDRSSSARLFDFILIPRTDLKGIGIHEKLHTEFNDLVERIRAESESFGQDRIAMSMRLVVLGELYASSHEYESGDLDIDEIIRMITYQISSYSALEQGAISSEIKSLHKFSFAFNSLLNSGMKISALEIRKILAVAAFSREGSINVSKMLDYLAMPDTKEDLFAKLNVIIDHAKNDQIVIFSIRKEVRDLLDDITSRLNSTAKVGNRSYYKELSLLSPENIVKTLVRNGDKQNLPEVITEILSEKGLPETTRMIFERLTAVLRFAAKNGLGPENIIKYTSKELDTLPGRDIYEHNLTYSDGFNIKLYTKQEVSIPGFQPSGVLDNEAGILDILSGSGISPRAAFYTDLSSGIIVTNYAGGESLESLIEKFSDDESYISKEDATGIIRAIGKSLGIMHKHGIIHREIYNDELPIPSLITSHIFWEKTASGIAVRFIDFGRARSKTSEELDVYAYDAEKDGVLEALCRFFPFSDLSISQTEIAKIFNEGYQKGKASALYDGAANITSTVVDYIRKGSPTYIIEPARGNTDVTSVFGYLRKMSRFLGKKDFPIYPKTYVMGDWDHLSSEVETMISSFNESLFLDNDPRTRMIIRLAFDSHTINDRDLIRERLINQICGSLKELNPPLSPDTIESIVRQKVRFMYVLAKGSGYLNPQIDLISDLTAAELDRYEKPDQYNEQAPDVLKINFMNLMRLSIDNYFSLNNGTESVNDVLKKLFEGFIMRISPINWEGMSDFKRANDLLLESA